jgi:hypothetical protein
MKQTRKPDITIRHLIRKENPMTTEANEVLVLTGEGGEIYAIPRDVVERHRLTGERKQAVERELGDDVTGYSMYQQFMSQQLADIHQAEARKAGAEARMARQARSDEPEATGERERVAARSGIRAALVGAWRTLPFVRTADANP